jgi:predicted kinase
MGLEGLAEAIAAPLHHALMFDLALPLLQQGFSLVLDGAAFHPIVRRKGRAVAERAGAAYFLIECYLPDIAVLQERIDQKTLRSSQVRLASLAGYERPGTSPLTEPHLRIDTRRPFAEYLAEALAYVGHGL